MKVAVTGGSGFIGSYIALELAHDKNTQVYIYDIKNPECDFPENVRFVEGDILYRASLDRVIKDCEEVFDCAGLLGTHELVFQTERAIETNIRGAINVLQSCLEQDVKRLFHPTKPMFLNTWENTYTITKIAAENFCRMYRKVYKMDITILRWMNASGPGQHIYPIRKFIPLAICLAILGMDIEIYGDGEQTMDVIDVRDIARIAVKAARMGLGKQDEIWDVGTGKPLTCNEVAKYIIEKTKSPSKIIYVPMRIGEPYKSNVYARNHLELFESLGYKLQYNPYQTIDDCIAYYSSLDRHKMMIAINYYLAEKLYKKDFTPSDITLDQLKKIGQSV